MCQQSWEEMRAYRGGACIDAVLDKLFADRLQVDNDLTRLDLMDRTPLNGLDCGHVNPSCKSTESYNDLTRSRACPETRRGPANQAVGLASPLGLTTESVTESNFLLTPSSTRDCNDHICLSNLVEGVVSTLDLWSHMLSITAHEPKLHRHLRQIRQSGT